MTPRNLIALAALGSLALLIGAFLFQYVGDLAPCKLCFWQRWPHAAAVLIGGGAVAFGGAYRMFAGLGALAALSTAGVGAFHVGVEQKWWQGPTGCTGFDITGMTAEQLMDAISAAPLVRCDEIAWSMAGISMAGWNAIASVGLALIWIAAMRRA